jgi:hypothetical protein
MWFKWLALKEFKSIVLPDYLPENDLQLEIESQQTDIELEIEDIYIDG